MNVEERLMDALSEFDRVEPSLDLFDRVEESVARDRAFRRGARRSGAAGTAGLVAVAAFLVSMIDFQAETIRGWAVLVAELLILGTVVVVLGRVIPRFGQIYVADVFRLDRRTGSNFLRLHDVAFHLVFGGYVIGWAWHPEMSGQPNVYDAIEFLIARAGGLLLLIGTLHAVTLMVLPVVGLLFGTIVRDHARTGAGAGAPPEDPAAVRADRYARLVVWGVAGLAAVGLLVGLGLVAGIGLSGS